MTTQCVLDSSVIVAAFRSTEPNASEALRLLERVERGALVAFVPVSVLVEVVSAIRRRTGSERLARLALEKLLSLRCLHPMDIIAPRAFRWFDLAATSGLRGMDVLVVGVAQELDIPLVTLDDEMAERAASFVTIAPLRSLGR